MPTYCASGSVGNSDLASGAVSAAKCKTDAYSYGAASGTAFGLGTDVGGFTAARSFLGS